MISFVIIRVLKHKITNFLSFSIVTNSKKELNTEEWQEKMDLSASQLQVRSAKAMKTVKNISTAYISL